MKVTINCTAELRDQTKYGDALHCWVATAVNQFLREDIRAAVAYSLSFHNLEGAARGGIHPLATRPLPIEVSHSITQFDQWSDGNKEFPPEPFTFTLDIPEQYLRI